MVTSGSPCSRNFPPLIATSDVNLLQLDLCVPWERPHVGSFVEFCKVA